MDALRRLSRLPDSHLAALARAHLAGVRAALGVALDALPDDAGAAECRAALAEVAAVLAPEGSPPEGEPGTLPGTTEAEGSVTTGAVTTGDMSTRAMAAGAMAADSAAAGSTADSSADESTPPMGTPVPVTREPVAPVPPDPLEPQEPVPAKPSVRPSPHADAELAALAAELTRSQECATFLGPLAVPEADDTAALWSWFQLTLLRLPSAYATRWRARAADLAVAARTAPEERWDEWRALDGVEVVLPPLPRAGVTGVRLGAAGPLADWAVTAAGGVHGVLPASGDRSPLALCVVLSGWVAELAARDGQLHHCLESVAHRGVIPLCDAEARATYRQELAQRLGRLARQTPGSPEELRAALAVDEALCSVLHLPPAAPGSWWARVAEASQRMVLELRRRVRDNGGDVAVQVLAPTYREARRRTGGNDIPLDAGGRKGQVLAGLRLWASVEGRELPGRVVYRA
ncbi:hypothetical protein [Streptomyces spectabilis]|uniref:Uncharacterized protein n=1 Tax=Streptomyces spectabilis TaxID=68270 RepID=A0A5P2XHP2_STRST|nr:hypothetical protein [Streptomyces spectabilis]MBB5102234.1 hypothetical protein [Streptomyces spectabilis]MCI3907282.1 hypothetical protein [Streptomyces spectabilis]QEV64018.1 hypothetical protein CP982_39395 [Streptomyces spectabilis]GGV29621.1 hypothetical protein GCM10010245_48090 [Streptomyces spectabilis]